MSTAGFAQAVTQHKYERCDFGKKTLWTYKTQQQHPWSSTNDGSTKRADELARHLLLRAEGVEDLRLGLERFVFGMFRRSLGWREDDFEELSRERRMLEGSDNHGYGQWIRAVASEWCGRESRGRTSHVLRWFAVAVSGRAQQVPSDEDPPARTWPCRFPQPEREQRHLLR